MASTEEESPLFSLPASIICFSLCHFLEPNDILALRAASTRTLKLLHDEEHGEELWKILLHRHFGYFDDESTNVPATFKALNVVEKSPTSMSVFGVDPRISTNDLWIETPSAFLAWKQWLKASYAFYENKELRVHAPFFLRAARFWKRIFQWCDDGANSGAIGQRIKQSLDCDGWNFNSWCRGRGDAARELRSKPSTKACQAVYSFCGGQRVQALRNIDDAFAGLMGGYQAYGYYSCCHLICDILQSPSKILIGTCPLSRSQGMNKLIVLDPDTGEVQYIFGRLSDCQNAVNTHGAQVSSHSDDILVWLEEYSDRLQSGIFNVGVMGSSPEDPQAITLFPRIPRNSAPFITEGIQRVSRAVTRGVEVVASGVYVPQASRQFGFIYSIRVRLLTPQDADYVPASARGFLTCQLRSRHWRITNDATGQTDQVDGDGVIGMYPLLMEGGYIENDEECNGVFQYQSCTGQMERGGSFGGHMRFVPGSIQSPSGNSFDVELNPFALDPNPVFLY